MEFEVTQRILDDKILMEKNRVEELGDYYTNLYNEWKYVNGSFQIIAENLQSGERTCLHSGHSEELMRFYGGYSVVQQSGLKIYTIK